MTTRSRLNMSVRITVGVVGVSGLAAASGWWLLAHQAAVARKLIGKPLGEEALSADKTWKKRYGDRLDLLILGDSIAAGLGAELPRETLGARLARKLAKHTQRAVRLHTAAVVGAESSDLAGQLAKMSPTYAPDVAVIIVGGNDVTHRVPVSTSIRHLVECIEQLQARGCAVVVGTCPDLGTLRPVPQPLRVLGSRASRQLAAAQRDAALACGAHVVSLSHVVGAMFYDAPDEMFSLDQFHPSALGYKRTAKAILPSLLAALGLTSDLPSGHHVPA